MGTLNYYVCIHNTQELILDSLVKKKEIKKCAHADHMHQLYSPLPINYDVQYYTAFQIMFALHI